MSPRNPAKSAQTVPLPNGSKLPTASSSAESFWRNLPSSGDFFTRLGPQIRLPPVPNFGVNTDFWDFCQDSLIDVYYSLVAHPRCNDQVEQANDMVLQAVKDRIFDEASQYATRWHAELSHVIWCLRTQVSSVTGYSPFFLVYGSEAVLPTDVAFGALRMQHYEKGASEETRKVDLDSIEEHRIATLMQHTWYEQQLRRYHDRNVRYRSFNVRDLVLRRIQSTKGMHKLSALWEGPFIVMEVVSPSTYHLQWADGQGVPNVWNIEHLRRFYP
jgi:hypothetical protein